MRLGSTWRGTRYVVDESVGFIIAEEARSMLQGVGSRFDFHINKTLCDLRYDSSFVRTQFTH